MKAWAVARSPVKSALARPSKSASMAGSVSIRKYPEPDAATVAAWATMNWVSVMASIVTVVVEVGDKDGVGVEERVGEYVGECVAVSVGVGDAVSVSVGGGLQVPVGVTVDVDVRVDVMVFVGVFVAVGKGSGAGQYPA